MGLFDWFMPSREADITPVSTPTTSGQQQKLLGQLSKLLRGKGSDIDWLETDPSGIVSRWQQYIADPMMSAWERIAGPMAARKYNVPGSFYSADTARGLQGEAENYLQTQLFPSLFSSVENQQARLAGLASSLATGQTMNVDTVVQEQPDYMGQIMQMMPFLMMAV